MLMMLSNGVCRFHCLIDKNSVLLPYSVACIIWVCWISSATFDNWKKNHFKRVFFILCKCCKNLEVFIMQSSCPVYVQSYTMNNMCRLILQNLQIIIKTNNQNINPSLKICSTVSYLMFYGFVLFLNHCVSFCRNKSSTINYNTV